MHIFCHEPNYNSLLFQSVCLNSAIYVYLIILVMKIHVGLIKSQCKPYIKYNHETLSRTLITTTNLCIYGEVQYVCIKSHTIIDSTTIQIDSKYKRTIIFKCSFYVSLLLFALSSKFLLIHWFIYLQFNLINSFK